MLVVPPNAMRSMDRSNPLMMVSLTVAEAVWPGPLADAKTPKELVPGLATSVDSRTATAGLPHGYVVLVTPTPPGPSASMSESSTVTAPQWTSTPYCACTRTRSTFDPDPPDWIVAPWT